MTIRTLKRWHAAQHTSDGDGVQISRVAGPDLNVHMDPYLMLDELRSDNPDDYIGGFPAHPNRGFETITYMRQGSFMHKDHMGNEGSIVSGGVQWMTAGRGVIHSEMPGQQDGALHGFQIWLNLPEKEKMKPASWQDIQSERIPKAISKDGSSIAVIAGHIEYADSLLEGPLAGPTTEPALIDVSITAGKTLELNLPHDHQLMVYLYDGEVEDKKAPGALFYSLGNVLSLTAGESGVGALVLGGKALKEPIAQHGPFVMNTFEEIEQAISDYQAGVLTD